MLSLTHPQLSLTSTWGLTLWAAVRASWVLCCDVVFRGIQHTLSEFVQRWVGALQQLVCVEETPLYPKSALSLTHDLLCVLSMDTWWNFGHELKKKKTPLYRQEGSCLRSNLIAFLQGQAMFPLGMQMPLGVAVQPKPFAVPKSVKWQHMLQDAKNQIQDKLNNGCDVAFCDGSRSDTAGLSHARFAVWFGEYDPRNEEKPIPPREQIFITIGQNCVRHCWRWIKSSQG